MDTEHTTTASLPQNNTTAMHVKPVAVRSMEIMAEGDRIVFDQVIHPEAFSHMTKTEPPQNRVGGPEGFYAVALWLRSVFADLHHEILHAVVEGDLVALDTIMTGRHVAPFVTYNQHGEVEQVFAPTGKRFAVSQTHWLRIADDKLIEHWAARDDLGMAKQAGWIPPTLPGLIRNAFAKRGSARVPQWRRVRSSVARYS